MRACRFSNRLFLSASSRLTRLACAFRAFIFVRTIDFAFSFRDANGRDSLRILDISFAFSMRVSAFNVLKWYILFPFRVVEA